MIDLRQGDCLELMKDISKQKSRMAICGNMLIKK